MIERSRECDAGDSGSNPVPGISFFKLTSSSSRVAGSLSLNNPNPTQAEKSYIGSEQI
ncbi:Uncharacterized protein APZ42_005775 [Daphnia magna]|uniref:Uncharacterized protein n=1 Tax=Daphnia magna TaxID=35525 RepID=A0A164G9G8_9CRUS|nr:Uncharacterized protein APZ42_005775 [Daphnia magna]